MRKEITIKVKVKDEKTISTVPLKLRLKIFSKDDELIYVWKTYETENFFLAVIYNSSNYIYPNNIRKDLRILTSKEEIAEQLIEKTPIFDKS